MKKRRVPEGTTRPRRDSAACRRLCARASAYIVMRVGCMLSMFVLRDKPHIGHLQRRVASNPLRVRRRPLRLKAMTHRREVEAILAGARAERAALLDQLSPALQASLPVDATGITQAIDHLGD